MSTFGLLLSLFFIMGVGFVSGKVKFLDEAAYKAMTKFVFYIATSALVIQSVASLKASDFNKFPRFILANCAIVVAAYALVYLALRLSRISYKTGASILFAGNVPNSIYIGLPLIKALSGQEGLLYAIAFLTVPLTVADVAGFYLLSKWRLGKTSPAALLKDFFANPIVAAIVLGIILIVLRIKLPEFVLNGLNYLGITATGLALYATGLYLSHQVSRRFNVRTAVLTSSIKLGFIPLLALALGKLLFGLSGTPLFVTVMMAAMPSAIFCLIVASQYDFDERKTADAILLSSLLFLATSVGWAAVLK